MIYRAIGTMSGSSMDGLDMAYVVFEEIGGQWSFQIEQATCIPFSAFWQQQLPKLTTLSAPDLLIQHTAFGRWMGEAIQAFIQQHQLEHKVHIIGSHGHTVFHNPAQRTTFQLGDGAAIAASTDLPVVSDLRNMDVALGGQGAPIIPIGEKWLWKNHRYFLNIGGICNISDHGSDQIIAYDVCPANRVLNALAQEVGLPFDNSGTMAATGNIHTELLEALQSLSYYQQPPPKSLANEFGLHEVLPLLHSFQLPIADKMATMVEHIAEQVARCITPSEPSTMVATGGGVHHQWLQQRLQQKLAEKQVELVIPDTMTIDYKEAMVMAFIAILRWREEVNVLQSVTGARRSSVGGALWMGQL